MSNNICGIDFGTSNSTIGNFKDNKAQLIKIENNSPTIPSAVFYEEEYNETVYGRKAINYYKDNYQGRLLRSLKSVLGTSLMNDKTKVQKVNVLFTDIIYDFIKHLKDKAEHIEQANFDSVVLGRPINFVDNDEEKNKLAEQALYDIALKAGFKNIKFQYEPIAASLKYEQSLTNEELVMIIDIGGGTTDISIVNLSPSFIDIEDRSKHCLANHGVHIGGTDFDKHLSLNTAMPLLGYKQQLDKGLEMPKFIYHDTATWHRINNIYTPEFKRSILSFKNVLKEPYYNRLLDVIDYKLASHIALLIEESKIELSNKPNIIKDLSIIEKDLTANITQQHLIDSIQTDLESINKAITTTLKQAQVDKQDIHSIFLTGGSSQMSLIKTYIKSIFPNTRIDNTDSLSSVGTGLVLDAVKSF
jgi:hypothetical chaperone protein